MQIKNQQFVLNVGKLDIPHRYADHIRQIIFSGIITALVTILEET
jgi:hypothetical protein